MKKKLLTLEDLVKFCKAQKMFSFSSKDSGYQLCVSAPASFSKEEDEGGLLLYGTVKSFHTGRNRNDSAVTIDAAKKSLNTFAYKPILAAFTKDKNGDDDFMAHEMEIDDDGNVVYIEQQVGCFTTDKPKMEKDPEDKDKQFVYARCAIPREYTHAADIIERKGGTKVSVELIVNEFTYDEEEDLLLLEDIEVSGLTLLGVYEDGTPVEEGMEGARLDIADFSKQKNSSINYEELKDVIKETVMQALNDINTQRKEENNQMNHFEELLQKYGKTVEEVTFAYEGLSDEELDAAFAEAFEKAPEPEITDDASTEPTVEEKTVTMSITMGETVRTFARSLGDVIYALSDLVNATYSDDQTYYGVEVFDDGSAKSKYLIMVDVYGGKAYKQSWSFKDGVYALKGERVEVYSIWVTAEERDELESLRSNYAALNSKFEETEKELDLFKEEPEKLELINSDDYAAIRKSEDYENLSKRENYFSLSKDDIKTKLDGMLLDFAKTLPAENEPEENKTVGLKKFGFREPTKKVGRYGGIFANEKK